jgi:hypothetical protein
VSSPLRTTLKRSLPGLKFACPGIRPVRVLAGRQEKVYISHDGDGATLAWLLNGEWSSAIPLPKRMFYRAHSNATYEPCCSHAFNIAAKDSGSASR